MRNLLLAATGAVALYGAGLGSALAQYVNDGQDRWMRVDNISGIVAERIYIIPSGKDCCWSRDLLEVYVIPPKLDASKKDKAGVGSRVINFDDGSGECVYDIRVTSQNNRGEWNFDGLNVCRTDAIALKPPTNRQDPSKDNKVRKVMVRNDSSIEARTAVVMPSLKDCCWSQDVLGKDVTLPAKTSFLADIDDGSGECLFDILFFNDQVRPRADWVFDKIDVCSENGAPPKTITLKDGPPRVANDGKKRVMTVRNESKYQARAISIIPTSSDCCWSGNLLGRNPLGEDLVIREKQSEHVDFNDGSGACTVDIRVTGPGREWNFDSFDVCRPGETTLVLK